MRISECDDYMKVRAYSKPGVYSVHCLATNFALFGESENVYKALRKIYYDLRYRASENAKMLADFKEFGEEEFRFEILDHSSDFEDLEVRKARIEQLKEDWGYDELY